MKRNLFWKFALILFVVAWAVYEQYPPSGRNLIADFESRARNRDANFTNILTEVKKLQKDNPQLVYGNLVTAVGENDLKKYFPLISTKGAEGPNKAILNRLQKDAAGKIKLGLDLMGGTSFRVEINTNNLDKTMAADASYREGILSQAVEVLRKRVDKFGVAEPTIVPIGENKILIQMPGLSEADKEAARRQIERVAFLEFRLVHEKSEDLLDAGMTEPGYEVKVENIKELDGNVITKRYLVKKKSAGLQEGTNFTALAGKHIDRASMTRDVMTGRPGINFELTTEGARIFADVTRKNVNQRLAILLDGEVYSAPVINSPIETGRGEITGNFDDRSARELANVLENPLETPVTITETRSVDPSLGKDSIISGVRSAIIGTIAVSVFMLVYYLFAGIVANVAMLLNLIILLGVMASVDATLTLPGIAGIVLTIGMAVDANVLIFERIREEQQSGKSLRGAIAAGYDKAFGTIFDSNLTTLISSVILIYMGTGPVKGFGVSLTIGVAISMFTALFVTRLIFDWMLSKNLIKSLKMMQIIKPTKINFLRYAIPAFVLSWSLILVGIGYGVFIRGEKALGVDFVGGDTLTMTMKQPLASRERTKLVEDVRTALDKAGVQGTQIQVQSDLVGTEQNVQIIGPSKSGAKIREVVTSEFVPKGFVVGGVEEVGPSVGKEIQISAVVATLLAMFGILVYVAFRYEFSFAVAAVIAIMHDVLMTMGWFFLTNRELSAPMVAAILTIIGFSINDTIVIFDRIREDLKIGVRGSFRDVINIAINQTFGRTIITSGTVLIATLSLYLFGGGVINDFAFTFVVGILTGTYSTIYIASATVMWWHKGQRPKLSSSVVPVENNPAPAAR